MKKINLWGFSVDDIGLDGYSTEEHLDNILNFLDEYQIKATFFAVPEVAGKKMSARRGYVSILRDAIRRGHEVGQHGVTHDRFEIGIPPEMIMMLPHEGPARAFLAENREKLKSEHTVEKIRRKLSEGRKILEDAIGTRVNGFRSPALQSCDAMFIALAEEKYSYDSSTIFQKAGWDILNNRAYVPQEINREKFTQLQKAGLRELPLTTEYTWYLGQDNFDKEYDLAVHDFDCCMNSGIPFINASHVSPIQEGNEPGLGFELYRKLIEYSKAGARKNKYEIKTMTLFEIAEYE
ncbi:MAG: polysaccharide deacetylase family protein [Verrucomicrobiota bacterium]